MSDQILVCLIDRHDGHFYLFNKDTERLSHLEDLSDAVPRPPKSASWAGLADDRIQRHVEEHIREHFKRVLHHMEQLATEHTTETFIVGGPQDVLGSFMEILPEDAQKRVLGVMHPDHRAGVKELEEQVQKVASEADQKQIQSLLNTLEEQRGPSGRAVVGQEPVYESLNLKQVQSVLLEEGAVLPGAVCPKDGAVSASLEVCPVCMGAMDKSADLASEAIPALCQAQDADLVITTLTLPLEYEHIAALRRFS